MDVVRSTHVMRTHLDGRNPVLIELELATADGDDLGTVRALLSPALAEELGLRLTTVAAALSEVSS
jgi:hypothetical protein